MGVALGIKEFTTGICVFGPSRLNPGNRKMVVKKTVPAHYVPNTM